MHEQNLLVVIQDVDPQLQEPKKGWLSFAKSLLYTCALPSMKIRVEHSSFSTRLHKQRSLLQPKFIRNINKKNFSNLKNIGALYYVSLKIYYHIILGTTSSGNPLDIQSKSPKINKRQSSTKSITKFKNNTSIRKLEGKRYPNEIGNLTETQVQTLDPPTSRERSTRILHKLDLERLILYSTKNPNTHQRGSIRVISITKRRYT